MKPRDVIALVSLCIGFGLVAYEINKAAGTVLVVLFLIYYAGGVYLRSDVIKKEGR